MKEAEAREAEEKRLKHLETARTLHSDALQVARRTNAALRSLDTTAAELDRAIQATNAELSSSPIIETKAASRATARLAPFRLYRTLENVKSIIIGQKYDFNLRFSRTAFIVSAAGMRIHGPAKHHIMTHRRNTLTTIGFFLATVFNF